MMDKVKYTSQVQEQFSEWKSELQKFRVITELADKDDQVKHYQVIDEITDILHLAEEKLEQFNDADQADSHRQTEIDNLRHQMQAKIEAARSIIN